jgi:hypothetical protein
MAKKKYTLYLPVPLARKLDLVARERHGAKSALVEEALKRSFEPQQHAGIEDGLARRLDQIGKTLAALARDQTVSATPTGAAPRRATAMPVRRLPRGHPIQAPIREGARRRAHRDGRAASRAASA